MKIQIQTTRGPRTCLGYETCVRGLVAHRVDGNARDWTLSHLASGQHFRVSLPTLEAVRHMTRATENHMRYSGFDTDWSKPLDCPEGPLALAGNQRLWALQFQRFACQVAGFRAID